jgi:type I restriction enzyme S subunit
MQNTNILENIKIFSESLNDFMHLRDYILTQAVNGSLSKSTPESWKKSSLGEEVEIIRGITFPSSAKYREAGSGRIVCLRTSNVQETIDWEDLLYVPESYVKNENQYVKQNDILISMANSRELVGKVSLVTRDDIRCTLGGFIATIRCKANVLPQFLMILLRVPATREKLIDSSTQTTNIANISLGRLRPLEIHLPTLDEQMNIVNKVSQLLEKCDQLEALQKKSDSLINAARKSAIDAIATSKTPQELQISWRRIQANWNVIAGSRDSIDDLRSLILELEMKRYLIDIHLTDSKVKSWSTAPLREVCDYIQRGKSPKYASMGTCRVVSQKCVRWSGFDSVLSRFIEDDSLIGYSSERFLQDGDLLWNSTGTGTVGRTALFTSEVSGQAFVADSHVTVLRSKKVHPEYLYYWSRSPDVQDEVLNSTTGSTNQQELNLGKLKEMVITFPSMHEQELAVGRIKALFALCDQLEVAAIMKNEISRKFVRSVVSLSA